MFRSVLGLAAVTMFSLYALEHMEVIGDNKLVKEEIKAEAVESYQAVKFTDRIAAKSTTTAQAQPAQRYRLKAASWQIEDLDTQI